MLPYEGSVSPSAAKMDLQHAYRRMKAYHMVYVQVKYTRTSAIPGIQGLVRGRLTPPAMLAQGKIQLNVKGAGRRGP